MRKTLLAATASASLLLSGSWALAQAPLTVEGITDKNYGAYADAATFRVPSTNGYSYQVLLDGNAVPTDVTIRVNAVDYHELNVWRTNVVSGSVSNLLVRFIVHNSARRTGGSTEDGIPSWTPYPTINSATSEFEGAHLRLITPQDFPAGYPVPVVAWVENDLGHAVRANGPLMAATHPAIQIKRGAGSGFLAATNPPGTLVYEPQVGGLGASKTVNLEAGTTWTTVSGLLAANTVWPANSRIHVTANLTNPAGSTLTIGAGTIVKVNPSTDIGNNGTILINGTTARPVVFMPATSSPWGGFIQHANNASFTATGAIFTGSGAYQGCWFTGHGCSSSVSGIGSHRGEQALISLKGVNCHLTLTDCAAMFLAGQFSHTASGSGPYVITLSHFLMQRVTTGGEYTAARFVVNDSAFMECLEDLTVGESPEYVDGDNDGLYIVDAVNGAHAFTNSLWGWTKDDGVDSGGSGAGQLNFQSCWFESILHEGNSLSGTGKDSRHYGDVFLNCGQGIEDGYDSPTGRVDRCLILNNLIGVRFGDNYDWTYGGFQWATNCLILNNHRDVWGMNWQTDAQGWIYRTNRMDVRNNLLTVPNPFHPANEIWNPATDASRLANYMTTPLGAAVGVGLAVWENQFALTNLFAGAPVRLSSFTTNFVSVDYTFQDGGGATLATGALTFAPGETLKRIYPAGFDVSAQSQVHILLSNPVHGELTGETTVSYIGSAPAPQVTCWVSTNTLPLARLPEGLLVKLSAPAGQAVSVDYAYTAAGSTLASGTLTFAPGQTVQSIGSAGVDPAAYNPIRLTLSNPIGAPLSGIGSVIYGTPPVQVTLGVSASQLDLAAFTSGLPVALNGPSTKTVSVDFSCEGTSGTLTNGTLTFTAGQTLKTLQMPTVNPNGCDMLRVSLSQAVNAELFAPTNVLYVRVVHGDSPILIAAGSSWRYLDTGGDAGTAWRNLAYNDTTWSNGPAQLGFGDNDEQTKVRQVGTNGQNSITWYFRQKFVIQDPGVFTNLALWLLRDDGGVVYLNGTEVFRSDSLPPLPAVITYQTLANTFGSAPPDNTVDTTNLPPNLLVAGTNIVAVEIHQQSTGSSDISFDFSLTGQPTPPLPPQSVYWGQLGPDWVLAWSAPGYVLEASDRLPATNWVVVPGPSPAVIVPSQVGPQKFYRIRH